MIRTLAKSIREYRKQSILSPVLVSLEVIMECIIPLLMARLIDDMTGESMKPILVYGGVLILLSMLSLFFGAMAAREASTASCGLAKNLRQDMFFRIQEFAFTDIDRFYRPHCLPLTGRNYVAERLSMLIRGAFRAPLMMLYSVIMALTINPKMAQIFLGPI
jgi:ATP-binding cassette subfamily B protein